MWPLLAQSAIPHQAWYALPLIVSISLVYGATRHELIKPILHNALRAGTWVAGFMFIIFLILWVISWML